MGLIIMDQELQAGLDGLESYFTVFCICVMVPLLCGPLLSIHTGFLAGNFTTCG